MHTHLHMWSNCDAIWQLINKRLIRQSINIRLLQIIRLTRTLCTCKGWAEEDLDFILDETWSD